MKSLLWSLKWSHWYPSWNPLPRWKKDCSLLSKTWFPALNNRTPEWLASQKDWRARTPAFLWQHFQGDHRRHTTRFQSGTGLHTPQPQPETTSCLLFTSTDTSRRRRHFSKSGKIMVFHTMGIPSGSLKISALQRLATFNEVEALRYKVWICFGLIYPTHLKVTS